MTSNGDKHVSGEVQAARRLTQQAVNQLPQSPAFQYLPAAKQATLLRELGVIQRALEIDGASADQAATFPPTPDLAGRPSWARKMNLPAPKSINSVKVQPAAEDTPPTSTALEVDPYALSMATPLDLARRRAQLRQDGSVAPASTEETNAAPANGSGTEGTTSTPAPRRPATETLASRAGALSDEIDFPAFVAGLIHGTFDAMVDAAIRQTESFAELVSAVAKDVDRFTTENVSPNQVRDWLVNQYPRDLMLQFGEGGQPRVVPRPNTADAADEPRTPVWLADYGLEGQELTEELIESDLVPMARQRVGENRLQMLATMVLMGMNRIVVRDGSISARVRFRAAARDRSAVDLAISQDPSGGSNWGGRGSSTQSNASMMVSTVGVNVQAETDLKAELFGEVKINFVSETLPLERFADAAQMTLLQRNARTGSSGGAAPEARQSLPASTTPTTPANGTTPAPTV
ncbi:MAG: hypothetical protein KF716_30490 [Anaerolineae bacterium]|nr:hypothetical protein [Anaerolineae bacterium]